jgi:hypothetical protein
LNSSSSGGILNDVSEGGMAMDILIGPKPTSPDVLLDLDLIAFRISANLKKSMDY